MKNLFKSLILLLVIVSVSCDSDTSDMMTSDSVDGGALLKVMPSIGKTLGNPLDVVDLENTQVSFTDVELDLTVQLQFGGENITKYEIVKIFDSKFSFGVNIFFSGALKIISTCLFNLL